MLKGKVQEEEIFTYCMKIVTWNIRGLNDLSKQREIRSMVTSMKIQLKHAFISWLAIKKMHYRQVLDCCNGVLKVMSNVISAEME